MTQKQATILISLIIISSIGILYSFEVVETRLHKCNTWQKDITDCKQKNCCVELRNKQPDKCFLPKESCSMYE